MTRFLRIGAAWIVFWLGDLTHKVSDGFCGGRLWRLHGKPVDEAKP